MKFAGRISLPNFTIYECKSCGRQAWVDASISDLPPDDQPLVQQQQQIQSKDDDSK
jgi:hypothetical protein